MDPKQHRLRVRIGDSEFEAEGDEVTVKEQYSLFLEALKTTAPAHVPPPPPPPAKDANGTGDSNSGGEATAGPSSNPVTDGLLERSFSQERGVVSLRVLPQGKSRDADALLLLLYGYAKLRGELDVYGVQLMKAARQSGLMIDRIDRVISSHRGLYIRGGARRGARYALNNQGMARAEQILKDIYE